MKAYIFKNKNSHKAEYGWVYVHVPGLREESLAIELIEFDEYFRTGNLNYKDAFLKEDLVLMPDELLQEFKDRYGDCGDALEQIVKEVLDADKVMRAL